MPNYRLRNDWVLVRRQPRGMRGKLLMPETSAEGVDFFVVGYGPDVDYLHEGDQVMLQGAGEDKYYPVPGETSLLIVSQKLVAYIIEPTPEEEAARDFRS